MLAEYNAFLSFAAVRREKQQPLLDRLLFVLVLDQAVSVEGFDT